MNYVIKNEYYTATVTDVGAELISLLSKDGRELMWQDGGKGYWGKHAPLLFPACGRLKNQKYTYGGKEYALKPHGFIGSVTFDLVSKTDSSVTLVSHADESTLSVYPFNYELTASYTLSGEDVLCEVTVKNADDKTMPYMFGWHPGFALPTDGGADIESYAICFGEEVTNLKWTPLQNGPFATPTPKDYRICDGKYPLCEAEIYANDTMIFSEIPTSLVMKPDCSSYKLALEWSENTPYLCIWKHPENGAKFICLEPWSSIPNDGVADEDFETRKMARLGAGECDKYTLKFRITL